MKIRDKIVTEKALKGRVRKCIKEKKLQFQARIVMNV
jgi:hypothetical protein